MTVAENNCRVYWGSHGCKRPRGHDGLHVCSCCDCNPHDPRNPDDIPDDEWTGCVGAWPYYGPDTTFYGEDAPALA